MNQFRKKTHSGLTLIEIMVTIVITSIAVIAAMGFRYYCAMDARRADVKMSASRIASLLIEDWNGMSDPNAYNPASAKPAGLTFSTAGSGPAVPTDFTKLRNQNYKTLFGNATYYITLSYKYKTGDIPTILNASIAWKLNYQEGTISSTDPSVSLTTYSKK